MEEKNYRIGNLVHLTNIGLHEQKVIPIEHYDFEHIVHKRKAFRFNPIPLTEQWLIDFGFEYQKSGFYKEVNYDDSSGVYLGIWAYKSLDIALTYSHDSFADWDDFYTDLNIKYVHELQNLYFALTGRELELKTKTL